MMFYVGLHQPADARHFDRAFISVNRIRNRKSMVPANDWIMDSGAFTEISTHGCYRHEVGEYAEIINRNAGHPGLTAAVAQDYMCEPWIVAKTGLDIATHQQLTIERYVDLIKQSRVAVMPVLQGFQVDDYLSHVDQYGGLLGHGAYVGVGSVCKRNVRVDIIEHILTSIKRKRPDLRLHGFGLKSTALGSGIVRKCLYSADSMAWSYAARIMRRGSQNDWREAKKFERMIEQQEVQEGFIFD